MPMRRLLALLLLAVAATAVAQSSFETPGPFAGIDPDDPSPHSDATLVTASERVAPGDTFEVALVLTQDPGWHSYWLNGGDAGQPTTLDWRLPEGVSAGPLRFPVPEPIELSGLVSYGYEDEVALLTTITVADDYAGGEISLEGTADWLICADICLPATGEVSISVPAGASTVPSSLASAFAEWRKVMPAEVRGWTTEAVHADGDFRLRIIPAPGWAEEMEGAYFFPLDSGVIDYAAPQRLSRDGEVWVLTLSGSGIADTPERLAGILALQPGETIDGEHRGLSVNAPILKGAASVASSSMPGWGLPPVLTALVFAFLGGLLLNLMPCVFPILSIKILGFAQGRDGATMRRHGLLFGAGVLVSFLALAGALLVLREAGEAVGWGFQLQSPPVIAGLAVLMVVLALWMLGVVEFGGRLMGVAARADGREGSGGAFLSGVLATVVATPCTAPFMGVALGWALVQPAALALMVFAMLGIGMALPYVLLSSFPAWLARLPRPGPWMEVLKQALAFPLFLTAVWLVWTFGTQTGINGAGALLAALVLVGLAAWVVGRWPGSSVSGATRAVTRGLAVLALGGALALTLFGSRQEAAAAAGDGTWAPYDRAKVESLVSSGEPVFIDFTATWCLTCQANKASSLHNETVERAFAERGVHLFVADWTRRDDDITAALDALGRSGVPVYSLYPGGGADPLLLPELLTPGIVLDALDRVVLPPSL